MRPSPTAVLEEVLRLLGRIDAPGWVEGLDPQSLRQVHDLAVRAQDRLMVVLAVAVERMALDGAELVDGRGIPTSYGGSQR